MPLSYPRLGG
ncbi:hypothetical protein VCCP1050_1967, partial [Vibrio cholerae CP1050(23)]